jgi:hypothetical protein
MTQDDFIWLQDIFILDWKHKKGSWCLHIKLVISIWSWAFQHLKDVFFFQNASEINKIQIPFTIGIQTPTQCESMLSYGHNGAIFMDATFGTNDMKFYLFTLMGFDDHCTGVPLVWIITNRQIIEDLIEWLKPLKNKMLSHMPHQKPSCFFINNAPQELKALRFNYIPSGFSHDQGILLGTKIQENHNFKVIGTKKSIKKWRHLIGQKCT